MAWSHTRHLPHSNGPFLNWSFLVIWLQKDSITFFIVRIILRSPQEILKNVLSAMNENISAYYKWLKADGRKFFVFSFLFHIFKLDAVNQGTQKVSFFWQPPWHPCVLELWPHDKFLSILILSFWLFLWTVLTLISPPSRQISI